MQRRKYKSGSRWAFWRWSDVDNGFITRLHVIKTPWFAVCLHWIKKPDPEPWLHDHPVSFLSVILRGKYSEWRRKVRHYWNEVDLVYEDSTPTRRWFNWVRATPDDRHTITACAPHTLTLCFMGPKVREWGYHTDKGWVHWRKYSHEKYRGADAAV